MIEVIRTNHESCKGCNRCVRECPMEMANITYQDEAGNIKVKIDQERCIACGRCVLACKHNARYYYDDLERFFDDLISGVPISILAAPSIRTNIPGYRRLFSYLKRLGVKNIFDVSLGADICVWAHLRYLGKGDVGPIITQPCPSIVTYCERYRHDLLERLTPIHSPVGCASIYIKEYLEIEDRIAFLSPCVSKINEFESTGLADYNVTFAKLITYFAENNVDLPSSEIEFDHIEGGLGSLLPVPGGLRENIEYFSEKKLHVVQAEGYDIYGKLEEYATTPDDVLPDLFDVLNCAEGCNVGPAATKSRNLFEIGKIMNERRMRIKDRDRDYHDSEYKSFDETLDPEHFFRTYKKRPVPIPQITDKDIGRAFEQLGKTDYDKQNIDCGACGSQTCHQMARKIALNVNIPINCIVKSMDDAKIEHTYNIIAREQLMGLEKIQEADQRMRLILDSNPQITLLFDNNYRIVDCNPAALAFLGFESKEELMTGFVERLVKSLPAFQLDGRASIPLSERLKTATIEGFVRFETVLTLAAIERRVSVEFRKIPFEESFAIVGYIFDMTEIHKREMELKAAHELNKLQLAKLNLVVKASRIGLWDTEVVIDDPINRENIFNWSDELRQMLGFSDEKDFPNILSSWSSRLHPDDREKAIMAFMNHLNDQSGLTPFDVECRLQKKDGEFAFYHITGETVRDEEGVALRTAGALNDITEAKNILLDAQRQRIEAQAANEAKSSFLSTMSHEIRTPMNAILGITEIQMQNRNLEPEVKDALDRIYQSGDLLLGIINDILDLSKIEAGKLELIIDKYEIASLVSDTSQLNIMRLGSKPIEFEVNVDENLPSTLMGDELRVKQILNNILSNAFKYTTEGTVSLSVTQETGGAADEITVVFTIEDTGHGMTQEQVDKIFEEYSRFNAKANRTTEGTGLGMSITQNLIRMMKGSIHITSEPGKGTIVTVHLPQGRLGDHLLGREIAENLRLFRDNSGARMKRVQITREPMPYGRVLIVDDVETNIYVARGLLSPYELKIDSAESGFSAIAKIKKGQTYDIVFMDHMMPEMDGVEATKIIRGLGYHRPIVALTANAVAGQADMFLKNGFDDYISKPIDVRQLNAVLNRHIRDNQPPEVIEAARKAADEKNSANEPVIDLNSFFTDVFLRDASKTVAMLDGMMAKKGQYSEEEVRNYVVQVHGIKSALANIGNKELSAVALKLENASRNGNTRVIASETPEFLAALKDFMVSLKPDVDETDEDVTEDKDYLVEKLLEIKTACEEFDEDAADVIMIELKKRSWSNQTRDLFETISEQLLHSDFDDAVDAINDFLGD